jgi:uncharacterized membrane protein (Fun14 family)
MASSIGFGIIIGFLFGYLVATALHYRKIAHLRSMWNDFFLSQKSR